MKSNTKTKNAERNPVTPYATKLLDEIERRSGRNVAWIYSESINLSVDLKNEFLECLLTLMVGPQITPKTDRAIDRISELAALGEFGENELKLFLFYVLIPTAEKATNLKWRVEFPNHKSSRPSTN